MSGHQAVDELDCGRCVRRHKPFIIHHLEHVSQQTSRLFPHVFCQIDLSECRTRACPEGPEQAMGHADRNCQID